MYLEHIQYNTYTYDIIRVYIVVYIYDILKCECNISIFYVESCRTNNVVLRFGVSDTAVYYDTKQRIIQQSAE